MITLIISLLVICGACREKKSSWQVESFGERKVVRLENSGSPDSYLKFEFDDSQNLSAIYWQKNKVFSYLWDVRAGKIFIDVPSSVFFRTPSNFYESLERDIDIAKIKNSLTKEILEEFASVIENAVPLILAFKIIPEVNIVRRTEEICQLIRQVDLEPWYRAVEAEKYKIHALGLEYGLDETQAGKLLSRVDFTPTYRRIVGELLGNRKQFVVCLGENHPEDADKTEAIRLITELKPLGFNYLLVECILASDQKILDDYDPANQAKRKALLDYLDETGWANQSLNFGGQGSEPYVELIDAAKRLGLKVVAIAPPQRDEIESCRYHYDMALNVVNVLEKDPGAKIVVFAGATHAFPNLIPASDVVLEGYLMRQDIPDIVKKLTAAEVVSFRCIGGLKDAEIRKYLNPGKILEKHIESRGWHNRRFFIPVPSEISTLPAEANYYFIHLPQYLNRL